MKKIISLIMAVMLCFLLASCGNKDMNGGEISVFYYTYSDTYISSVRTAMDKLFKNKNLKFNNYDANGNQTTQTEQVQTAISKGSKMLIVNVVDTGSNDAAQNIVNLAKAADIPVVFFNRSVEKDVVKSYNKCAFVGTDYEMAGHMQGELIGEYVADNFDSLDLNKDGKINYVLFKGQEGNMEAIARTKYAVEDADKVLKEKGKAQLQFYDPSNSNKYLVDQNGQWSSAAATDYMSTILAQYNEANNNMVELVIANNDEMALGAVSALQAAGYNNLKDKAIPVFGVDATDAAKEAIKKGAMIGTVKQDADGMAKVIMQLTDNMLNDTEDMFKDINGDEVIEKWRVNIPYGTYLGE